MVNNIFSYAPISRLTEYFVINIRVFHSFTTSFLSPFDLYFWFDFDPPSLSYFFYFCLWAPFELYFVWVFYTIKREISWIWSAMDIQEPIPLRGAGKIFLCSLPRCHNTKILYKFLSCLLDVWSKSCLFLLFNVFNCIDLDFCSIYSDNLLHI